MEITNPFTKQLVPFDLAMVTEDMTNAWSVLMTEDELYEAHIDCESPAEWAAYMILALGPDRSGELILGSRK